MRKVFNKKVFPKAAMTVLIGTGALCSLGNPFQIKGDFFKTPTIIANASEIESDNSNLIQNEAFDSDYAWMYKNGQRFVEKENSLGYISKGINDGFILQVVRTEPGKEYTVEADILLEGSEVPKGAFLTAKATNASGDQHGTVQGETTLKGTPGQWGHETFTFMATSEYSLIGVVKWADANDVDALNTSIKIDNVKLTSQSLAKDVYNLVWKDEFNQEIINQEKWGYELGNIRGNEQQHYSSSKENVYLEDGNLVLRITDRPEIDQYRNTDRLGKNARLVKYNSGSVRTHGKQEFLYGKIEARMKLPKGKGAFPAFWTLGADFPLDGRINSSHGYGWPATGEIDIMEMIGAPTEERAATGEIKVGGTSNRTTYGTAHWYWEESTDGDKDGAYAPTAVAGSRTLAEDFYEDYHIFGINWTPDKIEWYVDDIVFNVMHFDSTPRMQAAAKAINRPQYIQFNLAAGGNWPGDAGDYLGTDDSKVQIDWVQWLQTDDQKAQMEDYYKDNPVINGASDLSMIAGEATDLLTNVSANRQDYFVDYSIDNEYMFINSGAEGGRNEVIPLVKSSGEVENLKALAPGVYNLHYTAIPKLDGFHTNGTATHKLARKTVQLTVLPSGLNGKKSKPISSIVLPEGWSWLDGTQLLTPGENYNVLFTNSNDSLIESENRRASIVKIPAEMLIRKPGESDKHPNNGNGDGNNKNNEKNDNNGNGDGNNKNNEKNENNGNGNKK